MNIRPIPEHGTNSRYSNQKCRCELCRAAHRAYNREHRARYFQDPEKVAAQRRAVAAHQKANPDKWRAYYARYRETHQDEVRASQRRRYQEVRNERIRANAEYRQQKPDVHRRSNSRYRARLMGNRVAPYERAEIFERDRGICHLCGLAVDPTRWDIDHVTPLSLGGADSSENVAVSHPSCNYSKGHRVECA